ncbi:MAG: hypothetical protein J7513_11030 [Solirubrobacteraceae bacterium]|nr:hypothetical protein [Solirubrobacteraceae bacterium]
MDEQQQPSEEELRAAFEAELSKVHVGDVIAQTIVSLINIGARRGGLTGAEDEEHDLGQLALAIEGVRRLLPLIEDALGDSAGEIKDALSQLQMAFAQQAPTGVQIPTDDPGASPPPSGKAERPNSGLWVPGQ